jgi:ATP/maltotriose-dependent transcriptional regulator MalT
MPALVLATKSYLPPPRPGTVPRQRLVEWLNEGLHGKLTLISATAGFGKATLVSESVQAMSGATCSAMGRYMNCGVCVL